jgi:hypothetical protein
MLLHSCPASHLEQPSEGGPEGLGHARGLRRLQGCQGGRTWLGAPRVGRCGTAHHALKHG